MNPMQLVHHSGWRKIINLEIVKCNSFRILPLTDFHSSHIFPQTICITYILGHFLCSMRGWQSLAFSQELFVKKKGHQSGRERNRFFTYLEIFCLLSQVVEWPRFSLFSFSLFFMRFFICFFSFSKKITLWTLLNVYLIEKE